MKLLGLRWLWLILMLSMPVALRSAEPVKRQTDSPETDLISALITRKQLELAARICESHLNETQLEDDVLARWLIQAARVDNAFDLDLDSSQVTSKHPDEATSSAQRLDSAKRIDQFLTTHPSYPQRSWLQFQQILHDLAQITRDALTVLVSSGDQKIERREHILSQIVRAQTKLRDLTKQVEQQINEARTRTPVPVEAQDLIALVYQIAEKRVATVLLQSDLFELGSQDSIASATEAMNAAKLMLDSLPAGSQTRSKFLGLYAEALRRISRFDEALKAINEAITIDPVSSDLVASAVRIEIAAGHITEAQRRLSTYQSTNSAAELEFYLALLEYTIAEAEQTSQSIDQNVLSQQIQRIRERFGAYAKRRAQQLVLGIIPVESSEISDPQLLIARAGQWLREGKADDAVEGLMTAARATKNGKDAMTLGIAAAAIERKREAFSSAADCLREISLAHVNHEDAPKLHYQATLMMREHWRAPALIEQLQEFLITWPHDSLAMDAANWLDQLAVSIDDYAVAARTLTSVGLESNDTAMIRSAYDRWITALDHIESTTRQTLAEDAIQQLQSSKNDIASCLALQVALLCVPATQVQPVEKSVFDLFEQRPCFPWLAAARGISYLGESAISSTAISPESFAEAERLLAIDRLIADARQSSIVQDRVGKALLEIDRFKTLALATQIQAYDWAGNHSMSRSLIPADLKSNDIQANDIATVLAASKDVETRRAALKLWNQIAAHLPLGTAEWHQAKLAILTLLVNDKQQLEASRLADYILLTHRPTDTAILDRYQAFRQQSNIPSK